LHQTYKRDRVTELKIKSATGRGSKLMETTINQYQILSNLQGIDPAECRKSMSNYDSFMNGIQQKVHIQKLLIYCRNAENSYFRNDEVREKKYLLRALDIIDSEQLNNEDLRMEKLLSYIEDTYLVSEKIMNRLDDLGVVVKW
jgi:hypothetical protein